MKHYLLNERIVRTLTVGVSILVFIYTLIWGDRSPDADRNFRKFNFHFVERMYNKMKIK